MITPERICMFVATASCLVAVLAGAAVAGVSADSLEVRRSSFPTTPT